MDPTSLATAMLGAQMGQMQMAMAATMLRMNAEHAASIAKMIEAAQQNFANLANAAAGVGQNVNISV